MSFDIFLNFDGDCRAALDFYSAVFQTGEPVAMTYGQNPGGCADADKDRILYASLPIFGHNVMFSDCPTGEEHIKGTNIALTLGTSDADEIRRIFAALSDGGEVYMPLDKTFFSELYGMVCDKFNITWQLSLTAFEAQAPARQTGNTDRFTGKAASYAAARPSYAPDAIDYILRVSPPGAIIADIGAGTGKLTLQIAQRGGIILAVEPNDDMRKVLTDLSAGIANISIINGTAENTSLPDGGVDAVVCAQAFHWFEPESFRRECQRILRPNGKLLIVYNIDPCERGTELEWLPSFAEGATKYEERAESLREFLGGYMHTAEFPNPVAYDRDGFLKFMLSHSHSPSVGSADYDRFIRSVNAIFDRENVNGILLRQFVTAVYHSSLDRPEESA